MGIVQNAALAQVFDADIVDSLIVALILNTKSRG